MTKVLTKISSRVAWLAVVILISIPPGIAVEADSTFTVRCDAEVVESEDNLHNNDKVGEKMAATYTIDLQRKRFMGSRSGWEVKPVRFDDFKIYLDEGVQRCTSGYSGPGGSFAGEIDRSTGKYELHYDRDCSSEHTHHMTHVLWTGACQKVKTIPFPEKKF